MSHKSIDIIRAWKDPDYRSGLSSEELASIPVNPAGEALSDIEAAMITAGQQDAEVTINSGGLICTLSGECSPSGKCCNPLTSW
jgi:mersacidin/lichenicidin family type 2 lantibiotic